MTKIDFYNLKLNDFLLVPASFINPHNFLITINTIGCYFVKEILKHTYTRENSKEDFHREDSYLLEHVKKIYSLLLGKMDSTNFIARKYKTISSKKENNQSKVARVGV